MMETIYKEVAIDAEGNVDRPELLLEIKQLPNGSFMLIRGRLGAPNDTIVLDARALSAIDRACFGNLSGDEAFGSNAPAEVDAFIELVPTPEGEAAASICGHPLVYRAGADAGQLDEFHGFMLEEIAAVCEEKDAEIAYLRAITNGRFKAAHIGAAPTMIGRTVSQIERLRDRISASAPY
jgi:hypothetical protein